MTNPSRPPAADSSAASVRNVARIAPALAPSALSRPISAVRCVTETSITFITRMPATARLIAAMPATPSVSVPEHAVEGGQHRVLRDDRDVLLAFVARLDGVARLRLGQLDRVAVTRLDQDAEQRVGVEHLLRDRHRHERQFVGVHAQAHARGGQHADDAKTTVADAHEPADGGLGAEQLALDLAADHHHRRSVRPVLVGQEAALRQLEVAHVQVFGGGADDDRLAQPAAGRDLGRPDRHRRHAQHGLRTADRARVVEGQVARGAGHRVRRREAAGLRAAGQHDHQVRAERRELVDRRKCRAPSPSAVSTITAATPMPIASIDSSVRRRLPKAAANAKRMHV